MGTTPGTTRARSAGMVAALLAALAMAAPAEAQQRELQYVSIAYDVGEGVVVEEGSTINSPSQIAAETFVRLDVRLILDEDSADSLVKTFDGSTAPPEPSGCTPGDYGPMAMERDLSYSIVTPPVDGQSVRATIYPGERSEHWANDVFCEYDPKLGDAFAVAVISGFFYVRPRQRQDSVDVLLRAIVPTQTEMQMLLRR